jgi:hypothetical protein
MQGKIIWLAGGRDYSWANSPGGWLLFISLCVAVLVLKYLVDRFLARRRATELDVLTAQSTAFAAQWPEQRLSYVPLTELRAEADRCRRIISLLQRRAAAHKRERAHIDDQVTAVQYWLGAVYQATNTATERERRPGTG